MKHLLVTNDFPPKIGGIQSYLWELWRRLPAEEAVVLTTPFDGADRFDLDAPMRIERIDAPVMLPTRAVRRRILDLAEEIDADLVLLDPALPLGHLGPGLGRRYGLILHGAEVTVPGRVPGPRNVLARTLRGADLVIAAGGYPADEGELAARRGLPVVVVPPGVDVERFRPATPEQRRSTREALGLRDDDLLVVSLSRLVPRKGFDVLIDAAALLRRRYPNLHVLIGGSGRDAGRLRRRASAAEAPVRFLGRVDDADVPGLYAAADVFSMACRN
ncbi:MAG: glycosyltransferase family 4 protein, partial [Acidimicrobiales bacterium]|nr:glycosyltransferase family 4 protein [Acidimicrobiales bacterium]